MADDDNKLTIYAIPTNYRTPPLRLQKTIEGALMAATVGVPLWFSPLALPLKITTITVLSGGLFILGITGIAGDSFVNYLKHIYQHTKNKKKYVYDRRFKTYDDGKGETEKNGNSETKTNSKVKGGNKIKANIKAKKYKTDKTARKSIITKKAKAAK